MPIDQAREFKPIAIALLTVSDTRGPDEDTSGDILAEQLDSRNRPCNFVELMPRLREK